MFFYALTFHLFISNLYNNKNSKFKVFVLRISKSSGTSYVVLSLWSSVAITTLYYDQKSHLQGKISINSLNSNSSACNFSRGASLWCRVPLNENEMCLRSVWRRIIEVCEPREKERWKRSAAGKVGQESCANVHFPRHMISAISKSTTRVLNKLESDHCKMREMQHWHSTVWLILVDAAHPQVASSFIFLLLGNRTHWLLLLADMKIPGTARGRESG